MAAMKTWQGEVRLVGPATRTAPSPGVAVTARIVVDGDRLAIDRLDGVDGLGAPRWVALRPAEVTQESLCRALAIHAGQEA